MAETRTLARPYAEAVFELARARNAYAAWSDALALLEAVINDPDVKALADNPRLERARLAELLMAALGNQYDAEVRNFVRLLVDYRRIALVPEIRALYEERRADAEGRVDVAVRTALPLEDAHRVSLLAGLKRRFGREVNLSVTVDPTLIGGIEIRAGDVVIDGSVRSQLAALSAQLTQ